MLWICSLLSCTVTCNTESFTLTYDIKNFTFARSIFWSKLVPCCCLIIIHLFTSLSLFLSLSLSVTLCISLYINEFGYFVHGWLFGWSRISHNNAGEGRAPVTVLPASMSVITTVNAIQYISCKTAEYVSWLYCVGCLINIYDFVLD